MADNKSDYEKKGFLWHENESTVERKGNFTLKGKKLYGGIIKSFNDKGEAKYELFQSIGLCIQTHKRNRIEVQICLVRSLLMKMCIKLVAGLKSQKEAHHIQV